MAPLHKAVQNNQVEVIKCLKEANANINAKTGDGETPLIIATKMKNVDLITMLIDMGCDVNIGDINGTTPLHYACKLDLTKPALQLIEKGSDIMAKGEGNNTPLHFASLNMNKQLVEVLIKKGANAREMNSEGRTPLQGIRLTFAKFMKQLMGEDKGDKKEDIKIDVSEVLNQSGEKLETQTELKDTFCLLCRRRAATAALLPCGHLCICDACQHERLATLKQCPICKKDIYGACAIFCEN